MKRMTIDVYKILYKLTRTKRISVFFAVAYITLLNFITLQGLGLLMEGFLRMMRFIRYLFISPVYIVTAVIIFAINLARILPLKNLKKERQKPPLVVPILVYTGVCILIFLYMKYGNKIF
jgi:hypothetical protein